MVVENKTCLYDEQKDFIAIYRYYDGRDVRKVNLDLGHAVLHQHCSTRSPRLRKSAASLLLSLFKCSRLCD